MDVSSRPAGAGSLCRNLNHVRLNAPVRHCPSCGDVVNDAVRATRCSERDHDDRRRQRDPYCIDCGAQLIAS